MSSTSPHALRIVHHAGILHRDLKPPNVMLRENDDVALIDFGLARNLEGGLSSTRTGVLRGSPYYMSPEQALGEELDARTDLYSLGIIFYEMLTGRKPFAGTSAIEVLQQHVNAPLPTLPERHAQHQPLIDRMLAKARDQRFASAEEVIEAIAHRARSARAECSTAPAAEGDCRVGGPCRPSTPHSTGLPSARAAAARLRSPQLLLASDTIRFARPATSPFAALRMRQSARGCTGVLPGLRSALCSPAPTSASAPRYTGTSMTFFALYFVSRVEPAEQHLARRAHERVLANAAGDERPPAAPSACRSRPA